MDQLLSLVLAFSTLMVNINSFFFLTQNAWLQILLSESSLGLLQIEMFNFLGCFVG
jgi:hypothetical protein